MLRAPQELVELIPVLDDLPVLCAQLSGDFRKPIRGCLPGLSI
jgi:hypothetical protein